MWSAPAEVMWSAPAASVPQYKQISDAPNIQPGSDEIWYIKRKVYHTTYIGMGGQHAKQLIDCTDLTKTHIMIGKMDASNWDQTFEELQADHWSPFGEASSLITKLDVGHTSDVIKTR